MNVNVRSTIAAVVNTRRMAACCMLATAALLAACGASTVVSSLVPTRVVSFGDGLSDVGSPRYTVNDGSKLWVQTLAANYGLGVSASPAGQGWARGNARISQKPDAAGSAATLTVTEQVDAFLAANTIGKDDVVVLNGGISDLLVQSQALTGGTITSAQMLANATQAGKDLATQVRRLVNAGGTHVVVMGVYDLGKTPLAAAKGQTTVLSQASTNFNMRLLIDIVDLGANVLYLDAARQVNLFVNSPATYSFTNTTVPACTVAVQTPCTASTIVTGATYALYVFADDLYLTPAAHAQLGSYAYTAVKARW